MRKRTMDEIKKRDFLKQKRLDFLPKILSNLLIMEMWKTCGKKVLSNLRAFVEGLILC
jgi:hypothetical protein